MNSGACVCFSAHMYLCTNVYDVDMEQVFMSRVCGRVCACVCVHLRLRRVCFYACICVNACVCLIRVRTLELKGKPCRPSAHHIALFLLPKQANKI